jgi:PAS domain S-box-containing protein
MNDPSIEGERLNALLSYGVLDTDPEPDFDRFVHLAARLFSAPMALISFVDEHRQWFKARVGVDIQETPRAIAFCAVAIERNEVCLVPDTLADPRFADNPLVRSGLHVRFYAGAPLITPGGHRIGTLCVLDTEPHPHFAGRDSASLAHLAALVVNQLELRRERRWHQRAAKDAALINDILSVMAETHTMRESIDRTIGEVLAATDAAFGVLLELRAEEDIVRLVSVLPGPGRSRAPYAEIYHDMPQHRSGFAMSDLFEQDGATLTKSIPVAPQDDYPIIQRAFRVGVRSYAGLSLHVGGHRFILVVSFDTLRGDLDEIADLLQRLRRAIRPVLRRKLVDEQLTLVSAALAVTQDAVVITEAEPITDPGPIVVFANDGFTRMTGWQIHEVIGRTPVILAGEDADPVELGRIHNAMRARQMVRGELPSRRRDGSPFWVELDIAPLSDDQGQPTHWVIVQRDVTERRRAADLLREREQEARQTAAELQRVTDELMLAHRLARMGPWRWAAPTRRLTWSPEVYRMFGVQPHEIELTLENALMLVHPEDREQMAMSLAQAALSRDNVEFDFRTQGLDGVVRHCHSEGTCKVDKDGQLLEIYGFCQDVTERKEAEALLLRSEKLKSNRQLTGGIAHDFNNLLTVVSLNLEIASDMLGDDHPAREMLEPAMKAAISGAQLTSSLLSFARRQPLRPSRTNVNALVTELQLLAMRTLGERHHLALLLDNAVLICLLDRAQFESALLNLLVNSRDALPDGGTITVTTAQVNIVHGQRGVAAELAPGPYVTVSVSDAGIGIPPDLHEKVFEPFFTTKTVGKGTGLGLSMVIGFVRQSGGQVELESAEGQGTTVRMYLPAVPAED